MPARATSPRSKPFTAAIHELAARGDAAVLLDLEGTVLFVNDGWERFVRATSALEATPIGTRLADGIQGELPRKVFEELLARVTRAHGGRSLTITTECNGPDRARLVTSQLAPVLAGHEAIGVTVIVKVVRELPAAEVYQVVEGTASEYRGAAGTLEQCCCCRRTRRPADPAEWDFVPALVAVPPPDTWYAYCPLCHELHDPLGGDPEA
jgi:PAS domain-containing protein